MKKLMIITALLLFAGIAYGQTLKKGCVVATTLWEITLQPDATMNQVIDIFNKYCQAFEKAYPGTKLFTLQGERGEDKYKISTLLYFESQELRNKYWPKEGESGPFDEAATEIFAPIFEEGNKLILNTDTKSTDWLVL
jgi:hypothetical protein